MKIEHNHMIAKLASALHYEANLSHVSTRIDAERANVIITRAAQTLATVSKRIDAMCAALTDAEMLEMLDAALAHLADTQHIRASRAIAHQVAQNRMKQTRLYNLGQRQKRRAAARRAAA
jgi:hypothetical protein